MPGWLAFALGFAVVLSAGLLLIGRRSDARVVGAGPGRAVPGEPCWTEEISSDGRHSCARSHCVNDALMEADARIGSGDFLNPHLAG